MTVNEKKIISEAISALKSECETLEELFLQSRFINLRWIKQSIEENVINKLKKLSK